MGLKVLPALVLQLVLEDTLLTEPLQRLEDLLGSKILLIGESVEEDLVVAQGFEFTVQRRRVGTRLQRLVHHHCLSSRNGLGHIKQSHLARGLHFCFSRAHFGGRTLLGLIGGRRRHKRFKMKHFLLLSILTVSLEFFSFFFFLFKS